MAWLREAQWARETWGDRMDGDRPIRRKEEDRLGFSPVAEHLAKVIADQSAQDGLVFGIEGKWGSGKSTLVNLTIDALKRHTKPSPEIIEFSPWLVGARDDLIHNLFDELATAASRIDPTDTAIDNEPRGWRHRFVSTVWGDSHSRLRLKERMKKLLGKRLTAFGSLAGGASKLAKAAGSVGVPFAAPASATLHSAGEATKTLFASNSLTNRKSEIVDALRHLSRRIVIFVDDLDRLEPHEANEVLRLIRAVADFPNVIYVLSYDDEVVAKTLQKSVQVDDGFAYLEKIIQVSFKVPRPEAFDLRRWFWCDVNTLFPDLLSQTADTGQHVSRRLESVIDKHGGRYLNTPRDVIRTINALRLHAIPVKSQIDIADMAWLQLLRLGNKELYAWTEEYVTEASALYWGAGIDGHSAERMGKRLDKIIAQEGIDRERARIDLEQILPGLSRGFNVDDDVCRVFNNLERASFRSHIAERRLASPEHYRFYFAFAQPSGALGDDQVDAFVRSAERAHGAAVRMFAELAEQERPQGGMMAEVLIERLFAVADQIPVGSIPGILASLANNLDNIALSSGDGAFGRHRSWQAAEGLVKLLLKRASVDQRADCLRYLFQEGTAVGWITSVLRSEIFAHGHYGERAEPEEQRLLTPLEFKKVRSTMLSRFEEMAPADLMKVPNFLSLLYGWDQASGNDDVQKWVEANTQTDNDLLTFLSQAESWSDSSTHGVRYPLNRSDLRRFLDYDNAVQRVTAITEDVQAEPELRTAAKAILQALQIGRED
jgi:predicted KAP-like P-loop ATPase